MGHYYTLRIYKGTDAQTLRRHLEQAAKELGGSITWEEPGAGDHDLRLAHSDPVHTVYLPYQRVDSVFCDSVGERLGVPWMELRIQDGDIWEYTLCRGDKCLDTFSVCPQYWKSREKTDDEDMQQWRGKREVLAEAWGLSVELIENYLVNWGYQVDEAEGLFDFERKGKAYPSDEYEYGDYEQFYDFLKVLGGEEPFQQHQQHTIVLPPRKWSRPIAPLPPPTFFGRPLT